jgi:hypothetical protein
MDRLILAAPALIPAIGLLAVGIWAVLHSIFGHRPRIPADDDLRTCRRISALPTTQPRKGGQS